VEGYCESELELSDWKGSIQAAIIDIDVEFDIVVSLE